MAIARARDERARFLVADISGDTDILTVGLLAFAVIALFVAGIVIANTFTILVAHRTRNSPRSAASARPLPRSGARS